MYGEFFRGLANGLNTPKVSLSEYFKSTWPIVEPGTAFKENWHYELICEYLELVHEGKIRNIIFNLPPRSAKSTLITVVWPTWRWTRVPALRGLFASYSGTLSVKHNIARRQIIKSPYFRENWGSLVVLGADQDQRTHFQNTIMGSMDATSVGGTATGKGGDYILIDDPINADDAWSDAARRTAHRWYDGTVSTRLDDKKTGQKIIVEQRLHPNDISGYVTKKEEFTVVSLPAEAPERTVITFPKSGRKKVRLKGEPLHAEREGKKELAVQKKVMGTVMYGAQYGQNPTVPNAGILKRGWWGYFRECPKEKNSVWSWDTAHKDKSANDPTVGLRMVQCLDGYYITDLFRDKILFPVQKKEIENNFNARRTRWVLVEDKASGQDLIPALRRDTRLPIKAVPVDKDKVSRVNFVAPVVESQRVFLKAGAPWIQDFIDECAAFPKGQNDDQVDAFSQALTFFLRREKGPSVRVHHYDDDEDSD